MASFVKRSQIKREVDDEMHRTRT
uniref:Uncharacterized protein n=1 Tax=Anguilla anguilla TaxID=7936 RepID=A0A0E9U5U4_ANGAN